MQITNGSVSRTYKPADYEARSVAFSYTVDPGEDAEAAARAASAIAERVARLMPDKKEPTAAPNPTAAAVSSPLGSTVTVSTPVAVEGAINDNQLKLAFDAARGRGADALVIKKTIAEHTDVPGMSAYTVPQERRQALLDAINSLGRTPATVDY